MSFFPKISEFRADGEQISKILEPVHIKGAVDEEAIYSFGRTMGLPLGRFVIIEDRNEPRTAEALKKATIHMMDEASGQYSPMLNLGIVDRARTTDPEDLEKTVLHEAVGHAVSVSRIPWFSILGEKLLGIPARKPHIGLTSVHRGGFLEEGFAALTEAMFAQHVRGVTGMQGDVFDPHPNKYTPNKSGYHHAAISLEVLCAARSELIEPLFASRSDASAIPDVRAEIDAVRPGLFKALFDITRGTTTNAKYDRAQNFTIGMTTVFRSVGCNYSDLARISESGPLAEFARKRIASANIADTATEA